MERDYLSKHMTDGMKGYLCLCILAHHIQMFSGVFSNTYFGHFINRLGGWGVAVFFFISGYGLFTSYDKKGKEYIMSFPQKRILTFYITYYLWVIIYCAVMYKNVTLELLIKSFTFGETIVSFGWFFQYIGVFYILFYLAFRFVKKETGILLYTAVLIVFSIACFIGQLRCMCFVPFLAGILAAWKRPTLDRGLKKGFSVILIGSFVTFFAIYILYIHSFIFGEFVINPYLWELVSTLSDMAIILFAISICYWTRKLPIIENPVSTWLSRYSMEIYACQGIALYVFYIWVENVLLYIGLCVVGTIIMAIVSHVLLEFAMKTVRNICK